MLRHKSIKMLLYFNRNMLESSFIHLERFGKRRENALWSSGILKWKDFLNADNIRGISQRYKSYYDEEIKRSFIALRERDAKFFSRVFPSDEAWRLLKTFKSDAVYLDIETSVYYGDITIIGLYDGESVVTFVKGYNLNRQNLIQALKDFKLIITFNGSCFDIPIIKRKFGNVFPEAPHLDLRFACSRLGLRGGLKKIERILDIEREEEVKGIVGADAVYLWEMYNSTRKKEYLKNLIAYNKADIVNLEPIAEFCYQRLKLQTFDSIKKR